MQDKNFLLKNRFHLFLTRLRSGALTKRNFLFYGAGWLISYAMLIFAYYSQISPFFLFVLIFGYFWIKFESQVKDEISPPSELIVLGVLCLFFLEFLLLKFLPAGSVGEEWLSGFSGFLLNSLQTILLGIIILLLGSLMNQNSRRKTAVLIWYGLIGLFGISFLDSPGMISLYIFQFILFLILFRNTNWVEELTRLECWLYFAVLIIFFNIFINANTTPVGQELPEHLGILWYNLPYFLYLFFKLYLLAVIIKIPLVLVYHHASLSRKLRIAGLFQSTFPQLIQLFVLILFFYYFIAGWQANNLRKSVLSELKVIEQGDAQKDITFYKVNPANLSGDFRIPGFQPLNLENDISDIGIVRLEPDSVSTHPNSPAADYFLVMRGEGKQFETRYIVLLDSVFFKNIVLNAPSLAATKVVSYSFEPSTWEDVLYRISDWMDSGREGVRIFPFKVIPRRSNYNFSVSYLNEYNDNVDWKDSTQVGSFYMNQLTIGQVFMPLYNAGFKRQGYFSLDILLVLNKLFFSSAVTRYLVFLLLFFLVLNFFIIRRVVKFGNQINKMIVLKFNQLKAGIREVSAGNLQYKIHLEGEDEFVELADRFNDMGDRLQNTIEEVREKDRLEYELKIARQVQISLLPSSLPVIPGYEVAALLETATEVGGDFYDINPVGDGCFLFTIGDVSGKSTSAAFYMAQCISLFRFSSQVTRDPQEIVIRLNRYFSEQISDRQIFVTAIVGLLDTNTNKLEICRAGHPQPLILSGNGENVLTEMDLPGMGIGLERQGELIKKILVKKELSIGSGDTLIFYTDGIVEAARHPQEGSDTGESTQFYGEERMKNLIVKMAGKSADEIMNGLNEDLIKFHQQQAPADDYTIFVLKKR